MSAAFDFDFDVDLTFTRASAFNNVRTQIKNNFKFNFTRRRTGVSAAHHTWRCSFVTDSKKRLRFK